MYLPKNGQTLHAEKKLMSPTDISSAKPQIPPLVLIDQAMARDHRQSLDVRETLRRDGKFRRS